jgi:hypothetical protein
VVKIEVGYKDLPLFLYICIMERQLLHSLEIKTIKVIPMLLALIAVANTTLSYFDIDVPLLSYLGGVSLFPLLFLYLSSYSFSFCEYHRMFLHYVILTWVLNIIDYYWGIPVSDKNLFLLYMIIAGIFLFVILYLYLKSRKKK